MMKRSRWVFGVVCLLALASIYSVRHSVVAWFLSARFSTRIESKSLTTSFDSQSIELHDTSIELIDGKTVWIDRAHAQVDSRTLWQGDLIVDQLNLEGVSIPVEIPPPTQLALPALPDEFNTMPDLESWIEPWINESISGIDRDADRVLVAIQELQSRADQLRADLDRTLLTNPSDLHDRKHASQMAREYHAIKQRLAELRIQARSNGKDQAKKWSQISESISEKFQTRLLAIAPDANRQIQQTATTYSQHVTPTVLAYCDVVAAAMNPRRRVAGKDSSTRKTTIRRASLDGVLVDSRGSNLRVPFECQSCQWAWDSPTRMPTTSIWTFELPDRRGSLEIRAEQRINSQADSSPETLLHMSCYWYNSRGNEPFQAPSNRIHIEVQQSDYERLVRLSAPWSPRLDALTRQPLELSPLAISFRQDVRTSQRLERRSIPVALESVAIEPRLLFEMENSLEQNKQRWIRETHARWNELVPKWIGTKQEQSKDLWQRISTQCIDDLLNMESQLKDWQELWDCSTSLQQFRVGSKFASHPDAYSLPAR